MLGRLNPPPLAYSHSRSAEPQLSKPTVRPPPAAPTQPPKPPSGGTSLLTVTLKQAVHISRRFYSLSPGRSVSGLRDKHRTPHPLSSSWPRALLLISRETIKEHNRSEQLFLRPLSLSDFSLHEGTLVSPWASPLLTHECSCPSRACDAINSPEAAWNSGVQPAFRPQRDSHLQLPTPQAPPGR